MKENLKMLELFSKRLFCFQLILSILTQLTVVVMPYLEGQIVNMITVRRSKELLFVNIGFLVVFALLRMAFSYFTSRIEYVELVRKAFVAKEKFIGHMVGVSGETLRQYNGSYLHQRVSEDVDTVMHFIYLMIPSIVCQGVQVCLVLFILFRIYPLIAGLFMLLVLGYILLYLFCQSHLARIYTWVRESRNHYFSVLNNLFERLFIIKAQENVSTEIRYTTFAKYDALEAVGESFKWNFYVSGSQIILIVIAQVLCYIIAGLAVLNGQLLIGHFVILVQYFTLLIASINFFLGLALEITNYQVSQARLTELRELPREEHREVKLDTISEIRLADASHRVEVLPNSVLCKGDLVVITGLNGAGKSTFLYQLLGLLPLPQDLYLAFDDHDLTTLNLSRLRHAHIAIMCQNENLPEITLEAYLAALAEEAQANDQAETYHDILKQFQDTVFSFEAYHGKLLSEMSGGERQCFILLKTLLKTHATLYVLDEPFSNLSQAMTQRALQFIKERLFQGKMILIVSHDETICRQADKVITIKPQINENK